MNFQVLFPRALRCLSAWILFWVICPMLAAQHSAELGFTVLRTNLPGGRHANTRTMRAMVASLDGTRQREIAADLTIKPDTWTQFAGWSPDGTQAIILSGWHSPENAAWEEEHKTFRFDAKTRLVDSLLVDVETGKRENPTAVNRVSFYNTGLFYWPKEPNRLGFTALIHGESHPYRMDLNGANKVDLTSGAMGFTYGFSSSPDGKRVAYQKDYQVYVADADGSHATQVKTGNPFNFGPTWSADSRWVLFVSGEHHNCHPHVAKADGTGQRKLADRGGHRGVIQFLDVPDFHDGSSDTPCWAVDGHSVFYTAQVGESIELFRCALDGKPERLTTSPTGTLHYHPTPSADGKWLAYGSRLNGVRQIIARELATCREIQVTHLKAGTGAMWPHWRPAP
jgi:Tol biopolymer transport system component